MTRRRLGYVVWGSAFVVTVVPELLASINAVEKHLPFPTISRTVGHLEVINPAWEILPTFLIVLFVYALLRIPIPTLGAQPAAPPATSTRVSSADLRAFVVRAVLCAVLLVLVGVVASQIWPDQHLAGETGKLPNFYVAYAFWGTTFVVWVLLPTVTAVLGRRHSYASLPKTIIELEHVLAHKGRVGRGAAWTLGFILVWGMAFLLLHLTLYPFPDITKTLNKGEVVCVVDGQPTIVSRLPHDGDPSCRIGGYPPGNGG
jgi:hypothetical protein